MTWHGHDVEDPDAEQHGRHLRDGPVHIWQLQTEKEAAKEQHDQWNEASHCGRAVLGIVEWHRTSMCSAGKCDMPSPPGPRLTMVISTCAATQHTGGQGRSVRDARSGTLGHGQVLDMAHL